MNKIRTKRCLNCSHTFKTRVNEQLDCNQCIVNAIMKKEEHNPFSLFNIVRQSWQEQEIIWNSQKAIEKGIDVIKFWLRIIQAVPDMSWSSYQAITSFANVSPEYCLSKKEFKTFKKSQKNK